MSANTNIASELGAAGCVSIYNCKHLAKDGKGFYCGKYHTELEKHHKFYAPRRLSECGDDASKDIWSKIMRARRN